MSSTNSSSKIKKCLISRNKVIGQNRTVPLFQFRYKKVITRTFFIIRNSFNELFIRNFYKDFFNEKLKSF